MSQSLGEIPSVASFKKEFKIFLFDTLDQTRLANYLQKV